MPLLTAAADDGACFFADYDIDGDGDAADVAVATSADLVFVFILCLVPCCVGVVRPGERFRHVLNFLRCSSLPSFGEAWRYEEIMEGAGVFAIDELKEVRRGEIALSVNRVGFGL